MAICLDTGSTPVISIEGPSHWLDTGVKALLLLNMWKFIMNRGKGPYFVAKM